MPLILGHCLERLSRAKTLLCLALQSTAQPRCREGKAGAKSPGRLVPQTDYNE